MLVDDVFFDGYSLVWYDNRIVAAFESTSDDYARQSIFSTALQKGWIYVDTDDTSRFEGMYFVDPVAKKTHEFHVIWVREMPDFGEMGVQTTFCDNLLA